MKEMTGADLIKWITEHHAEDLPVIIEHRDDGGSYHTAEHLKEPEFCSFTDESYGVIRQLDFREGCRSAIIL